MVSEEGLLPICNGTEERISPGAGSPLALDSVERSATLRANCAINLGLLAPSDFAGRGFVPALDRLLSFDGVTINEAISLF